MGSKIVGVLALVFVFAALGDVLRNPQGTAAATNGANTLLSTASNAAAGYKT